jgi:hypothetical protein
MGLQNRIQYMIEKSIIKCSELSEYSCIISARTKCPEVDSYGIHVGDQGDNPFTCATCGGDGYIESKTTIFPIVNWLKGDEKIVTDAGILRKGDIILKIKTGYTLDISDEILIDSIHFKRIHKVLDPLQTFETWYCQRVTNI